MVEEGKITEYRYKNYKQFVEEIREKAEVLVMIKIAPSILSADFSKLGKRLKM